MPRSAEFKTETCVYPATGKKRGKTETMLTTPDAPPSAH